MRFHDQGHASVLITSSLPKPEEPEADLALFALYACRQLVNLGRGGGASSLASLCCAKSGRKCSLLADHDGADGPALVGNRGAPGRVRFTARYSPDRSHFNLSMKGLGFLGRGAGYYSQKRL